MDEWRATLAAMESGNFQPPDIPVKKTNNDRGNRSGDRDSRWGKSDGGKGNQANRQGQNRDNQGQRNNQQGQQNQQRDGQGQDRRRQSRFSQEPNNQQNNDVRVDQFTGMSQQQVYNSLKRNAAKNNDFQSYMNSAPKSNLGGGLLGDFPEPQDMPRLNSGPPMPVPPPMSMPSSMSMPPMSMPMGSMSIANQSGMMGGGMMGGMQMMNRDALIADNMETVQDMISKMNSGADNFKLVKEARDLIREMKVLMENNSSSHLFQMLRDTEQVLAEKEQLMSERQMQHSMAGNFNRMGARAEAEHLAGSDHLFQRKSELNSAFKNDPFFAGGTGIQSSISGNLQGNEFSQSRWSGGGNFDNNGDNYRSGGEQFMGNGGNPMGGQGIFNSIAGGHDSMMDGNMDSMGGGDYNSMGGGGRNYDSYEDNYQQPRQNKAMLPDLKTGRPTLLGDPEDQFMLNNAFNAQGRGGDINRGSDRRDRSGPSKPNPSGGKLEESIANFPWRTLNEADYEGIHRNFLYCEDCSVKVDDGPSLLNHLAGKKHREAMTKLQAEYDKNRSLMRDQVREYEKHKAKTVKPTNGKRDFCGLCDTSVAEKITIHRAQSFHRALKGYVHPFCPVCVCEFANRSEWEIHRFSAGHRRLCMQERTPLPILLKKDEDFMDELKRFKADNESRATKDNNKKQDKVPVKKNDKEDLKTIIEREKKEKRSTRWEQDKRSEEKKKEVDKKKEIEKKKEDGKKKETEKKKEDDDDIVEIQFIEKKVEPKDPIDSQEVGSLETYEESKVVGKDFLKPVSGFFCRVCKKLLLTAEEAVTHMKTKPHWDATVKATKTAAVKRKATGPADNTAAKVAKK